MELIFGIIILVVVLRLILRPTYYNRYDYHRTNPRPYGTRNHFGPPLARGPRPGYGPNPSRSPRGNTYHSNGAFPGSTGGTRNSRLNSGGLGSPNAHPSSSGSRSLGGNHSGVKGRH